jgi:DNA-binding transcriptional ArsR family regulator
MDVKPLAWPASIETGERNGPGETFRTETPDSPPLEPGVVGVLQALADPMRLAIVRRLAAGDECPCGALGLPISKSTLSHHLHVLRAAGVVVQRGDGTRRLTSLDREGLDRRFPGLVDALLAAPGPDLRCG